MNKVQLIGRITKDPELKKTTNETTYCQFTVAVDRRFKDANGNRQADFISCVAWRQTAEFIQKYFNKGSRIGLVGTLQTRTYDDNGTKRTSTEVLTEEVEFVESNKSSSGSQQQEAPAPEETPASSEKPQELPFEI